MPAHCAPPTLTDYFKTQLDKKLASLPDNRARVVMLAQQYGVWTENMRRFWRYHEQPWRKPHPLYGDMTAGDFLIVLGLIDGAKAKIERAEAA